MNLTVSLYTIGVRFLKNKKGAILLLPLMTSRPMNVTIKTI